MNICPVTNNQCDSVLCNENMCSIKDWQNNPQWLPVPKRNMVIKYSKKFAYAPYLNEDIGFEMTIAEHENPLDKMQELRQMAEQFHKANNPHLYQEEPIIKLAQPIEQTVKIKDDRIGRYLAIQAATTLEELEAVKIQPEDKLDIPYNTQKKKLQAK